MGTSQDVKLKKVINLLHLLFPEAHDTIIALLNEEDEQAPATDSGSSPEEPGSPDADMEVGSEYETDESDSHSTAATDTDGFETVKPKRGKRKAKSPTTAPPPTKRPAARTTHLDPPASPSPPASPAAPDGASQAHPATPATATPAGSDQPPCTKAPPPLYIQDKAAWNNISRIMADKNIHFTHARSTAQGIRVTVQDSTTHRRLSALLRDMKAIAKWLKAHPGRVVTHLQIAGLFNEAYGKAATVENACHGFKSTYIILDYMYEPAETTNIPLEDSSNVQLPLPATVISSVEAEQVLIQPLQQADDLVPVTSTSQVAKAAASPPVQPYHDTISEENNLAKITELTNPQAGKSSQVTTTHSGSEVVFTAAGTKERPSSSTLAVHIETLSQVPKECFIGSQGKRKPKNRQSSLVLTCTPNMLEIKSKNEPKAPPTKKKRKFSSNDIGL
ncbi:unnamed protein product [Euphydryas editha]|uniref:Flocculation protein FLO11-like n=1 Tax=Euphydryas editha TaxID=104508 RepID=A0AAU9TSI3_EUPED|nr:unnamed protein product [Euphydryas editha]